MYHSVWFFLGGLLVCSASGFAQSPKEKTTYIQTDRPLGISAEANDLTQPFFAAPSTANEIFENVEEIREKVDKLEERVKRLESEFMSKQSEVSPSH